VNKLSTYQPQTAFVIVLLATLLFSVQSWSQSQVIGVIDSTKLVRLQGNTHPLAQASFDQ